MRSAQWFRKADLDYFGEEYLAFGEGVCCEDANIISDRKLVGEKRHAIKGETHYNETNSSNHADYKQVLFIP